MTARDDEVVPVMPAVDLRKLFATFGATEGREYAPLYVRLAAAAGDDEEMLRLLDHAPAERRTPVLFFAAVHDLVLAHPDAPLARWYPSVTGGPIPGEDPYPAFRAFVREHRDAVAARLATRTVQTNEVNRCAALAPALQVVAREVGGPLALVEVGCSGGLNLWFDRYGYELGRGREGVASSPVVATAACRGPRRPPPLDPLPAVGHRVGIDRAPVDVRDDEAVRWLEACVWPEHPERHARLQAAVAMARTDPPPVLVGDALDLLPDVLAGIPAGLHPVVAHSWVLFYLSAAERDRFVQVLAGASTASALSWLSFEAPGVVPGLAAPPVPPGAPARERYASVIGCTRLVDGARADRVLARCHPHVAWLEWLGPT